MRLVDYLRLLRERVLLVMVVVTATVLAAVALSYAETPTYEATARLRVRPVAPASGLGDFLSENLRFQTSVQTEAELLQSTPVASRVAERLELSRDPQSLVNALTVIVVRNTDVLELRVRDQQPVLARDIANAFVDEYISYRREQAADEAESALKFVSERLEATRDRLDDLDDRLEGMDPSNPRYEVLRSERENVLAELGVRRTQQDALAQGTSLAIGVADSIERASLPEPAGSDLPRNAVLGFLIGLPMAVGLVLLLDSSDERLRSKDEAAEATDAEILGIVPRDPTWRDASKPKLASVLDPLSPTAEAYRMVAVNLGPKLGPTRRVLVTSPGENEGKTTTTANLAVALRELGDRVTVVSADLRKPRLHRFLFEERSPGLVEVLSGEVRLREAVRRVSTGLHFLPSGSETAHPHRLLRGERFARLLDHLSEASSNGHQGSNGHGPRTMVIDAPGVLRGAEVSSLASMADGIVLVVRAGETSRDAAREAAVQIRKGGGRLLGVVVVGAQSPGAYAYGYSEVSAKSRVTGEEDAARVLRAGNASGETVPSNR